MENLEFEIIRKYRHKLYVSQINDNGEIELCRQFVVELMTGMAQLSRRYFENMSRKYCQGGLCRFPYTYHERQLESIIVPTLSKMCNGMVITELPIDRKVVIDYEKEYFPGHADFWCIYQGFTFIIEVKHSYDNLKTDVTRTDTVLDRWNRMIEQLNSIDQDIKKICQENTKGIIRLGLHFITSYADPNAADENTIREYRRNIENTLLRIEQDLEQGHRRSLKPDFMACWEIPTAMAEYCDFGIYPGLVVAVKVLRTLKK